MKRVTFGFVNCNRLLYLRSCVESLLKCTEGCYSDREFIIVDNASVEPGTSDYLDLKEKEGFRVFRQQTRDPKNEFAKGLNIVASNATGDFVCPLQGDMQFVAAGGWLDDYVDFYSKNVENVGCMTFDAQRRMRLTNHTFAATDNGQFVLDLNRSPVNGAGDVMYSRKIFEIIAPWNENNGAHEGGDDSETAMLTKVKKFLDSSGLALRCAVPIISPAIAICTDARGTNARVRGNRRYGDYWGPKKGFEYYEIKSMDDLKKTFLSRLSPVSIEELAIPVGWVAPLDDTGNWKKNPIRPESASSEDFVELCDEKSFVPDACPGSAGYLDDWMNS